PPAAPHRRFDWPNPRTVDFTGRARDGPCRPKKGPRGPSLLFGGPDWLLAHTMEPTPRAQRSFEEEAEALLQRAVRTRGSAAAAFFLEAAEVYGGKLGRRDRAILCFQQASRADPQDAGLTQQLRRELFTERRFHAVFA